MSWFARVFGRWRRRSRRRQARIDPFTVGEPWRFYVRDALQARARFDEILTDAPAGAVGERLVALGSQVDAGVEECWRVAREAHRISETRDKVRHDKLETDEDPLMALLAETEGRLRTLDARLEETVARVAELSVRAGADLDPVGDDLASLVEELEALRVAMTEVDGPDLR